jgi:hypothetical protein
MMDVEVIISEGDALNDHLCMHSRVFDEPKMRVFSATNCTCQIQQIRNIGFHGFRIVIWI